MKGRCPRPLDDGDACAAQSPGKLGAAARLGKCAHLARATSSDGRPPGGRRAHHRIALERYFFGSCTTRASLMSPRSMSALALRSASLELAQRPSTTRNIVVPASLYGTTVAGSAVSAA